MLHLQVKMGKAQLLKYILESTVEETSKRKGEKTMIDDIEIENECPKSNEKSVFKCSKCDSCSLTKSDLNLHMNSEHANNKCKECDYISATNEELTTHVEIKHVKILVSNECEYVKKDDKNIVSQMRPENSKPQLLNDDAVLMENASFYCKVCGKYFEEFDLFVKHSVEKHGQAPGVKCSICEKGFADNKTLDNHIEEEHAMENVLTQERNEPTFKCSKCSKVIRTKIGIKRHTELFCEECEKCSAERVSFDIHNEVYHRTPDSYNCDRCEKTFKVQNQLNNHSCHTRAPQNIFCEKCPFISKSIDDIINHMKKSHKGEEKCEFCDYVAQTRDDMTDHIYTKHEDMGLLNVLAQQQKYVTEGFDLFRDEMSEVLKNLIQVVLGLRDGQNIVKQELFIIRQNQVSDNKRSAAVEKALNDLTHLMSQEAIISNAPTVPEPNTTRKTMQMIPPPLRSSPSPTSSPPTETTPTRTSSELLGRRVMEEKTLYVGDSISSNVNFDALEKGIKSKITAVKAYSAVYETERNEAKTAARHPQSNYTDVIAANLENEHFDNLIVQAGAVDITNLNTRVDPMKHFDYFEQQAVMSAKNLFSACERAVEKCPNLKNVIIMKQTPRYDPASTDPHSLKPVLSDIFNNRLTELWMTSKHKNAIFVGSHNIACTGSIREARYRVTKTGFFDGIHLCGSSGMKAYTNSVLNIFKNAGLIDPGFDHTSCPQSRHMAQKSGYQKIENWGYDIDTRRAGCGKKLYSEMVKARYQVPVKNRFSGLKRDQGNY